NAGGEGAGPGGGGLAGRCADRQAGATALLDDGAIDRDRAVHLAPDVDDADARGSVCRLRQLDFLAPREQHVELRLQQSAVVDVGDVDRPALTADVVD